MHPADIIESEVRSNLVDFSTKTQPNVVEGDRAATLTLTGFKNKGGTDINQDRAMVVSPFRRDVEEGEKEENDMVLVGVFDGHGPNGEQTSEYAVNQLPKEISSRLPPFPYEEQQMRDALHASFIEVDANLPEPARWTGGCTASVVLRRSSKIYLANSGDSRSFLATMSLPPSGKDIDVRVRLITREDKPSIPEERARVESMGGGVYIPKEAWKTSRVVVRTPDRGTITLAMSRSLGDYHHTAVGVIPDPLIQVLDLDDLKQELNKECELCSHGIFVVSATDGMMDELEPQYVADTLAKSLWGSEDQCVQGQQEQTDCPEKRDHLVLTVANLIGEAADKWSPRYRDDIALAVSEILVNF